MNPILLDLPFPIVTPRLLIRPAKPGDGQAINEAIVESFHDLQPWMPWANTVPSIEDTEEVMRRAYAKWILREDIQLSIYERASGKFAGGTGLHKINWDIPKFEIGYWVRSCFAGRGYIKESSNAITRYAFEKLKAKRVEIRCNSENLRSVAVMKSLGFEYEACLRNDDTHASRKGIRDTLVYARINPDGLPPLEVDFRNDFL